VTGRVASGSTVAVQPLSCRDTRSQNQWAPNTAVFQKKYEDENY
jgi:hypothetical protein